MIQRETILKCADNSGAKNLRLIGIPHKGIKSTATLGDLVSCSVKGADPNGAVSDHAKEWAVVVRTAKEVRRKDGSYIRFSDNSAVIVDKAGNPKGTRILGPIAREVKEKGFAKVSALAEEIY